MSHQCRNGCHEFIYIYRITWRSGRWQFMMAAAMQPSATSVTPSVYKCPKQTSTEQIKISVKIIHLRTKQAANATSIPSPCPGQGSFQWGQRQLQQVKKSVKNVSLWICWKIMEEHREPSNQRARNCIVAPSLSPRIVDLFAATISARFTLIFAPINVDIDYILSTAQPCPHARCCYCWWWSCSLLPWQWMLPKCSPRFQLAIGWLPLAASFRFSMGSAA